MKKFKIVYWISTGLLSAMMLLSASMYFLKHAEVQATFEALGYPAHIIYPLAFAKIAGLVAIWFINNKSLKEWAYAGFFFDFVLAAMAHIAVGDGDSVSAFVAILMLFVSYFSRKKAFAGN